MKKSLLLASALVASFGAFAATDGNTYESVDGYTFTSISANRAIDGKYSALVNTAFPSLDYVRTATILNGKVYVASSKVLGGDGALMDQGAMAIFDAQTGEYEKTVQLTVDGAPLEGLLCANCIDHDNFGNLYVCGYRGTMWASSEANPEGAANPLKVYSIDPATGACTLQAEVGLTEDDRSASGRVDFIDVAGDITRKDGRCVIMAAPSGADNTYVYGWACEQGSDEFGGHLVDGDYVCLNVEKESLYPEIDKFNGGTTVNIVADEDQLYTNFYLDDMNCTPVLLTSDLSALGSFKEVEEPELAKGEIGLVPTTNPTGAIEFSFGDDVFMLYSVEEYEVEKAQACRSNLVKLGEGGAFAGMKRMALFPTDGLGHEKGGPGARVVSFDAQVVTDDNGNHAAYVFVYKTGNGFAYYLFAEPGYQGDSGVEGIVADNNAPVEYFNLQGVRVANPENGVYIRRQGANVTKVVK